MLNRTVIADFLVGICFICFWFLLWHCCGCRRVFLFKKFLIKMSPIPWETMNRPWRKPNTKNELKSVLDVFGNIGMGTGLTNYKLNETNE